MQKFLDSIWARIIRLILVASAVVMGSLPFSYMREFPQFGEDGTLKSVDQVFSNYFIFEGNGLMDWMPPICIVLAVGALLVAVVGVFKENIPVLMWIARLLCFSLVAQVIICIFLAPTVWGWCIAGVELLALALTAIQEMKLEDKSKQ